MKILAFNASPRKGQGVTDVLMNTFLESATSAGAEVEKYYVVDLDVKGCLGCFSCWWKTPGRCVHRDDMDWILPKMVEADAVVFGTPVYHYNIVHHLQRLRERTLPLNKPEMYIQGGETHHPGRHERKSPQRTVVISVCGFPDLTNFNQVEGLFPDAVKILLPSSGIIYDEEGRGYIESFFRAIRDAGKELTVDGDVSEETRRKLIVDYPEEVKKMIVEKYNIWSSQATPGT